MGEPRDGEVHPVYRPARSDMPTIAATLERLKALNALLSAPLPGGQARMSNVKSLADRIRTLRETHERRLGELEAGHGRRLDAIEQRSQAAIDKLSAKLESDAADHEAEIRALEDEVNQLTNGGPA